MTIQIDSTKKGAIAKFISYYGVDCSTQGLANYPNIYSLLETFYLNNYLNIDEKHFFNISLLNIFDNTDNEASNKVSSLIFQNIIYEDEITYIDEQLLSENFNIAEIKLMMDYFDYYYDDKIIELINKDPIKYLRLLTCLSNDVAINKCLRLLNDSLTINNSHLDISNVPDDYIKKTTTCEAANMCILCEGLALVPVMHSNLYKIGINYFEDEIRHLFYVNLLALKEIITLDNDIIDNLEINFQNEKNEKNKDILSKILDFKPINIC